MLGVRKLCRQTQGYHREHQKEDVRLFESPLS